MCDEFLYKKDIIRNVGIRFKDRISRESFFPDDIQKGHFLREKHTIFKRERDTMRKRSIAFLMALALTSRAVVQAASHMAFVRSE